MIVKIGFNEEIIYDTLVFTYRSIKYGRTWKN